MSVGCASWCHPAPEMSEPHRPGKAGEALGTNPTSPGDTMTLPPNPLRAGCRSTSAVSPVQIAAALSAVLLIGASAAFGAHYAWSQGVMHGKLMALAAVAFALGLELAKPIAVAGMIEAGGRWQIGRALLLGVLALVAVAYSLSAELSLMARSRADAAAERASESMKGADARARVQAIRDEIAAFDALQAPQMPSAPPAPTCSGGWLANARA